MKAKSDAVSQAKTDFLSRMSHEIRTPMNAIAGMTTIARSALDDREKVLDCLVKIEQSNRYLLNLINDVLAMSRIESGKVELNPEPVLLEEVAISLDDMMRSQVTLKQLDLRFERHFPTGRPVYLDVLRFSQVFINIIATRSSLPNRAGRLLRKARLSMKRTGWRMSVFRWRIPVLALHRKRSGGFSALLSRDRKTRRWRMAERVWDWRFRAIWSG